MSTIFHKLFDNSRLKEKIFDITLPKEVIYKETKGEGIASKKRHGLIDDELIYPNRNVINTRYGLLEITPRVMLYFQAFTDTDSVLTIDIYNNDDKNLFKKFVIKSIKNNFSITDMHDLVINIKSKLTNNSNDGNVLSLIDFIRNNDNLIYEEFAQ